MRDRRDTKEEAKSVWERFGRRWIFGGIAAAALGIGALAITVVGMRRRAATEDAVGEPNETVGERFGEDRKEDQGAAALPKEELVRRAQLISRGPTRESQESERTDTASETEQEVRRYLKDIEYPASKDDLVTAARSNDAPQELIQKLVDLSIKEYSNPEEVAVAVDSLGGARGG